MIEGYSIKVNKADGVLEVSGPDKDWVDLKLKELAGIIAGHPLTNNPRVRATKSAKPLLKSNKRASNGRAQKNSELAAKLTNEVKDKLQTYRNDREVNFKSLPAQAAIIATFLQDELDWEAVDHNDMYTVYTEMGWAAPGNPRAQLNNAMARNHYFGGLTAGKYTLSHTGENFARHDSKTTLGVKE